MEALWKITASAKSDMAATGHPYWSYLGKCLADFHYIFVNYNVFEGWQSIGEVFCDNIQRFNEIKQDLIKYKPFSLQINVIGQHLTTTTKFNDIGLRTILYLTHPHEHLISRIILSTYSSVHCIFNRISRAGGSYEQSFATTHNSASETRLPRFAVFLTYFLTVAMKQQRTCLAYILNSADLGRRNVIVTWASFNSNLIAKRPRSTQGRSLVFFQSFPIKQTCDIITESLPDFCI